MVGGQHLRQGRLHGLGARRTHVDPIHDACQVGQISVVECIAKELLQPRVMALPGLLHQRFAAGGDRRECRPSIMWICLATQEAEASIRSRSFDRPDGDNTIAPAKSVSRGGRRPSPAA